MTAPRTCTDCPADISHRAKQARRCEACAAAAREASKRRLRKTEPRACIDCRCDITARQPMAKRCEPCAAAAILRDKQAAYANAEGPRSYNCHQCGVQFLRKRTDTLFCRHRCWQIAQRDAQRAARPAHACGWCGFEFRPVRSDAVYCGTTCGRRAAYALNSDRAKAKAAAWAAANPERRRAIAAADKARRKAAPGPGVRSVDWRRLVRRYGGRCAYCGGAGPIHMEHVIPLSRGGRHAIGNVLPACEGCNLSKHGALLVEWRRRQRRAARLVPAPRSSTEVLTLF